ncbi:nucleotidyltransferase domain-containing protein [Biomaibacter acetigenes]|uniref:Nucleotidyltransferase domain-containing protein n=1 Tax=Biomaibacter acetigenes TaxID=2316383 RepID=A0A3G2R7V6_9FIRM|nr:nucleotidyltransferase domain-containing protein [Biomaibacter acetigenes]AYO31489.1 nucleotidyltransferase domain-containing protein [Biomaibacter acetigenes]
MPVRSLNSSVLKWPDLNDVRSSLDKWAKRVLQIRRDIVKIGYFGSYARKDWGVGSDLDLVVVIKESGKPFYERPTEWDVMEIPVPVDLLIYTEEEFGKLRAENRRFYRQLEKEAVWIYPDNTQ